MNGQLNSDTPEVNPGHQMRKKYSDIQNPSPSGALVFIDESSTTLEDCYFAIEVDRRIWQDSPTDRHSRGATLSFADGHSELWKWLEPRTGKMTWREPAQSPIDRDFDRVSATIVTRKQQ